MTQENGFSSAKLYKPDQSNEIKKGKNRYTHTQSHTQVLLSLFVYSAVFLWQEGHTSSHNLFERILSCTLEKPD